MKPERIHVVRNEGKPDIPNRPVFEGLAAKAAVQMATPWWSHWLTYTSGGVAVVAGIFGVVHLNKSKIHEVAKPKEIGVAQTISSKTISIGFDTLDVDLVHGDTIVYKGCTRIMIPAGSITNSDGSELRSTRLLYRELRNAADWIAADVKMEFPNNQGMVLLESNGVFELKTLHSEIIHPEKQITVAFCTNHTQPDNHWYQGKNKSESWAYLQKAIYQVKKGNPEISDEKMDAIQGETVQALQKPARPKMRDLHHHAFDIDLSFIPELGKYKNVTFEVMPGQKYFPEELPEVMDKIKVKKSEIIGQYQVSFYDNGTINRFYVYPVFTNEVEYKMAMKDYNIAMEAYRNRNNLDAFYSDSAAIPLTETKIPVSEIKIRKFGLYQVAKSQIHSFRQIASEKADKLFQNFQGKVYQIFLKKNSLHQFGKNESPVALNSNENCVLLAKNSEGKWAYSDLRIHQNRSAFESGLETEWETLNADLDSAGEINAWVKSIGTIETKK